MTQTPLNIFDLLTANPAGRACGPITGQPQSNGAEPGLFDDLINSLLNFGGQKVTAAECIDNLSVVGNQLQVVEGTAVESPGMVEDCMGYVSGLWPTAPENLAEFNRQLLSILPKQTGVIRASVSEILAGDVEKLQPGKYCILNARVTDGRMALEVVSKDAPGRPIMLTIPSDVFESIVGRSSTDGLTIDRVSLGTEIYDRNRLDNLLSQLNVKELQVEASGVDHKAPNTFEPLRITLVAETTAGEQLLRAKLDRNRIQVSSSKTPGQTAAVGESFVDTPRLTEKVITLQDLYRAGSDLHQRQQSRLELGNSSVGTDMFRAAADSRTADNQQTLEALFQQHSNSAVESLDIEKPEVNTPRLMLPDDLGANLKVNGRALTIRIEPEHLGPARMSLTMINDKLKARIVVESLPAKVALETNLDRLVNDLQKADIKVDHIEITVSGDSAHNQLLGRQPHWRHRMITRLPALDGITSEPLEIPITPSPAASAAYIGPNGVNLLA